MQRGTRAAAAAVALLGGAVVAGASTPGASACELGAAAREATPSTACMACHDGAAGPGVSFQMSPAGGRPGFDHPVEIDYAAASARDHRLVPPGELPDELVLVGGKVACTTCHDGRSEEPGRVAGRLVALCTACHRM